MTWAGSLRLVPLLILRGAEIGESRVASTWVVEGLDEIEDGHPRFRVDAPTGVSDELALKRREEALGEGSVRIQNRSWQWASPSGRLAPDEPIEDARCAAPTAPPTRPSASPRPQH